MPLPSLIVNACAVLLPAGQDPWRIEARFEVDGERLVLAGSTDLPDSAVLRIDLFEADTEEGRQLASEAVRVSRGGSFHFEARPFDAPTPRP